MDLSDRTGRQLWRLTEAVLQAASSAKVHKINNATQDIGMGRWVDIHSGWRWIRIGIHTNAWSELGLSPVWASVWSRDAVEHKRLLEALAPLGQPGGPGVFTMGSIDIVVPIKLTVGMELGDLAHSIAQQVIAIQSRGAFHFRWS